MQAATQLGGAELTEIKVLGSAAAAADGPFVDPAAVSRTKRVLMRRGRVWAESVLVRELSERSPGDPAWPRLETGEMETLLIAERREFGDSDGAAAQR